MIKNIVWLLFDIALRNVRTYNHSDIPKLKKKIAEILSKNINEVYCEWDGITIIISWTLVWSSLAIEAMNQIDKRISKKEKFLFL